MNDEEYIKTRLNEQINWYDKKSISNKRWFNIIRFFEILGSTSIPFILIFKDLDSFIIKILIAGMGVLLTIAAALLSIYKFQEKWIEYRTICESLRHHKFRYETKTSPYQENDSFNEFVNNVEALISKENTNWAQYIRDMNTDNSKSKTTK